MQRENVRKRARNRPVPCRGLSIEDEYQKRRWTQIRARGKTFVATALRSSARPRRAVVVGNRSLPGALPNRHRADRPTVKCKGIAANDVRRFSARCIKLSPDSFDDFYARVTESLDADVSECEIDSRSMIHAGQIIRIVRIRYGNYPVCG